MYFKKLKLRQWQQFHSINIDFHEKLTVVTGANGSGKTTILNLFAQHFGWHSYPLSTPKEDLSTGEIKYCSRFVNGEDLSHSVNIGSITYSNDLNSQLNISNSKSAEYQIQIQGLQNLNCFYIPSHRSKFKYQQLTSIPTAKKDKMTAFNEVSKLHQNFHSGHSVSTSTSYIMKSTLISWAINGYGIKNNNKVIMPKDAEQVNYFEGYQEVLRKTLPDTLGFEEIAIRGMEIVFVCNGGSNEFLLETASGGISAILDITWQIFMYSTKNNSGFTVIIDEVENHLHPTIQRSILQKLIIAFPKARFIVSTHSPLVVGSVKESYIYALAYNSDNKVYSKKLDFLGEAKTASEVLDEVLGVSFTMPIWVEDNLKKIIEEYSRKAITKEEMSKLREELSAIGLEKLIPYAIQCIAEALDD